VETIKHLLTDYMKITVATNKGLAKVAVNQSLVLRINPKSLWDGENRYLREARKR